MLIGRGHVARGAAVVVLALSACHARGATTTASNGGCRAIAQTTGRYVDQAPADSREATLRFAVEVIDLCQGPGLSPATRKCIAAAHDPGAARACPGLAVVPLRAAAPPRRDPAAAEDDGTEYDFVFDPDAP